MFIQSTILFPLLIWSIFICISDSDFQNSFPVLQFLSSFPHLHHCSRNSFPLLEKALQLDEEININDIQYVHAHQEYNTDYILIFKIIF